MNDEWLERWLERWGLPAGLGLLGLVLVVVGNIFSIDLLVLLGVIGVVVGVVLGYRTAYPPVPPAPLSTVPVSDVERRARLENHLSTEIAQSRGRIESVTPYSAVVVTGRPVNHVLHLLASVFLCGMWIPIWILIAVGGGEKRWVLSVDPCGNVTRR